MDALMKQNGEGSWSTQMQMCLGFMQKHALAPSVQYKSQTNREREKRGTGFKNENL